MRSKNIGYFPEFDHIRAYAALLVIFYHGLKLITSSILGAQASSHLPFNSNPLLAILYEGHTAVALFMVLSGFIFTYGLQGEKIIYHRFIFNRILRIYPLFLLVLFIGLAAYPQNFTFVVFLQTIFGFANAPGRLSLGSFSSMFWTISIEWQFYLIFPFIYAFAQKKGASYLWGLLLLFISFRTLSWLEGATMKELTYWTIAGRIDQFLIGMILGLSYNRFKESKHLLKLSFPLVLMALGGLLYFFHFSGGLAAEHGWKVIWPTLEGGIWALFILTYAPVSAYVGPYFSKRLAQLGTISFSLYLLHFTIIKMVIRTELFLGIDFFDPVFVALLTTLFVVLPITILLAFLTYNFIEKPFLELRKNYRQ